MHGQGNNRVVARSIHGITRRADYLSSSTVFSAQLVDYDLIHRSRSPQHGEALERLFSRIGQMSSLPSVAQRVMQVTRDQESSAADLLAVVEQDQSLAIRILRTVNSSYCGLRDEVADLKTAISMLGFIEVRNLAMTVYVARLCEEASEYRGFSRSHLWYHMVVVGSVARLIAKVTNKANPDEAYLAGLLHDVGLLLIDQYMHRHLCEVIDLVQSGKPLSASEHHVLTFDHTDLGGYIARESCFPRRIAIAIGRHHDAHYCGGERELLDIVMVANYLANRNNITALGVRNTAMPHDKIWRSLGLRQNDLADIWEQLEMTLTAARILAGI
jgi:putative nucleotidyltransferase with HDIG domain